MPDLPDHSAEKARIHGVSERSLAARTRTVWLGFGLLLLLIVAGSVYSYVSVLNLQSENRQSRADSRARDELLDQLSNDIYLASTLARDYLLESREDRAAAHRREIETVQARMYTTLASYESRVPEAGTLEKAALAAFHRNIDGFWKYLEPPLRWLPKQRQQQSDAYLAEVLLPKSQEVEKLAREIALRDDREIEQLDRALQARNLSLQREMIAASTIVLLGGLAAAFLSLRRIRRLEGEAELRYEQVERARFQLRDLSSQLVNAQEEERRKLSRELHDQLGQNMSALVTELGRLEHDSGSSQNVRDRAAMARQIAEDGVRTVRDTALLLRPSMLDDLGLVPALRWQAREVRRRSNLKVRVVGEETGDDLPDPYKTCIYRVVQEALHNCVKHAQANEVRVVLQQTPEGLSVSVQDDGVGFDPTRDRGMGLLGMEERVTRLDGLFRMESRLGHGTVLSMLFPGVLFTGMLFPGTGVSPVSAKLETSL